MARRRKTHHRKHRRVSGTNKSVDLKAIGVAVLFAVAGRKLSAMLAKSTNTMAQTAAPYAELGLGIVLPMVLKNPLIKQGSIGLLVDGSITVLGKLAPGIISGPYQLPVVAGRNRRMNGGIFNPGGIGYNPARNSIQRDALSVINGVTGGPAATLTASGSC